MLLLLGNLYFFTLFAINFVDILVLNMKCKMLLNFDVVFECVFDSLYLNSYYCESYCWWLKSPGFFWNCVWFFAITTCKQNFSGFFCFYVFCTQLYTSFFPSRPFIGQQFLLLFLFFSFCFCFAFVCSFFFPNCNQRFFSQLQPTFFFPIATNVLL